MMTNMIRDFRFLTFLSATVVICSMTGCLGRDYESWSLTTTTYPTGSNTLPANSGVTAERVAVSTKGWPRYGNRPFFYGTRPGGFGSYPMGSYPMGSFPMGSYPMGYGSYPMGFGSYPQGYGSYPMGYGSYPQGFTGTYPSGFGSFPSGYAFPQGFGTVPQGYTTAPNGFYRPYNGQYGSLPSRPGSGGSSTFPQ